MSVSAFWGYNLETNLVQLECVCFQLSDSRMAICGTSDSSTLSINPKICYIMCSKLTWSYNGLIMRVNDANAHCFYLKEATQQSWSVRQLERNINTLYYQRLLSSKDKSGIDGIIFIIEI